MDYYVPDNSLNVAQGGLSALAQSAPSIKYPTVGDKILLMIHSYGGVTIVDPSNPTVIGQSGMMVEVEVTAEKKVKVEIV